MLKILGTGLSRTGTTSLTAALNILGLRAEHYCWQTFLGIILHGARDFRLFNDIEALTDIPAAYYHREIALCYPELKYIHTIREVDSWWQSMRLHCQRLERDREHNPTHWAFVRALHTIVYGSPVPDEGLYKRRYLEFNERIIAEIPADRLLVIDLTAGEGWDPICRFLGKPVPQCPCPHENKRRE